VRLSPWAAGAGCFRTGLRQTAATWHRPALQVNPEEERLAKWTTCQLTGMPLQPPCVCDELGNLFNKDAVIQVSLLDAVHVSNNVLTAKLMAIIPIEQRKKYAVTKRALHKFP
jgi:hypothetical protein